MSATDLQLAESAPVTDWRADAPALDEAWLDCEQRDAQARAWLERLEAERLTAACLI